MKGRMAVSVLEGVNCFLGKVWRGEYFFHLGRGLGLGLGLMVRLVASAESPKINGGDGFADGLQDGDHVTDGAAMPGDNGGI
jgi:hypothetical protein